MSKKATEFQRKAMSRMYRVKEIFKPLNTGWIDENVACVREWVANIFFYRKGDTTIMIDAGYNYDRLAEKMSWLGIDPKSIRHILITHQDTDHVGAMEADSPGPKTMSGFSDVPADSYYAKAVAWAVENGITGGTGDGKFSPDATCTRAQAVTFLYRASGAPAVSGNAAFSDVATNAYYAAAVKWAEKNGITGGIGGGLFGSDNNCTRAQIVTFLYRSYQSK